MTSPVRTRPSGPPAAASGATCRTTVPYAVPLIRPSQIRTMSRTPCCEQLGRQRHVGDLRHARVALGAAAAQHQHRVGVDVEVGVVDPGVQVLDRVEDDGPAAVLQQVRGGGGRLDDGTGRREVAVQDGDPGVGLQRLGAEPDDLRVPDRGVVEVVDQRPAR